MEKVSVSMTHCPAQIGILNLSDLDSLIRLPKDDIEYNKFDN